MLETQCQLISSKGKEAKLVTISLMLIRMETKCGLLMLDNNKARLITWLYIILVDALLQLFLKLLVDRIYPGGKPAPAEGII